MRKGLIGAAVGLTAAVGGAAWAIKKLLAPSDGQPASGTDTTETAPPPPRREGLDPTLLEILACPEDKEPVIYQKEGEAERLTCTKCGKRYPVRDGIPVMLIDEAQPGPVPTEEEIAAARALAPEGKPAIVGAPAATSSAPAAEPSEGPVQPSAG
jgi:uncharacterized protein YbaR (Trm112 family)